MMFTTTTGSGRVETRQAWGVLLWFRLCGAGPFEEGLKFCRVIAHERLRENPLFFQRFPTFVSSLSG
jgi:hypothetical protein